MHMQEIRPIRIVIPAAPNKAHPINDPKVFPTSLGLSVSVGTGVGVGVNPVTLVIFWPAKPI